jgi:hypothetical protein
MRIMMRSLGASLLVAGSLSIVALSACTVDEKTVVTEPTLATVPVVRSAADLVFPLDSYLVTPEQQHAVTDAINILGRDCLRRFGLEWPAARVSGTATVNLNARRYAVIDPAKAAVEGYHAVDIIKQERAIQEQTSTAVKPSNDAMNVWAGRGERSFNGEPVPSGGCAQEATRKLTDGLPAADPKLPEQLQLDAHARTVKDSRVLAVFRAWSDCMRKRGFDYPDPFVANDDQRWQTQAISREEIDTAVADVDCKLESNVAGTLLAVESAYQRRLIDEHTTELDAVRNFLTAEVANAARVVAGGGA